MNIDLIEENECAFDEIERALGKDLFYECCNSNEYECMKLLTNFPDDCALNLVNYDGNTSLMIACKNKMANVCMKILETSRKYYKLYYTNCLLDQVNKNGETALMIACDNLMENVCMDMLKTPQLCKLSATNSYGKTAVAIALDNNLISASSSMFCYLTSNEKSIEHNKHHSNNNQVDILYEQNMSSVKSNKRKSIDTEPTKIKKNKVS